MCVARILLYLGQEQDEDEDEGELQGERQE